MKLKPRYVLIIFSMAFATVVGLALRKVFNNHDYSHLPFLIINAAFMVSCYLAGYLMKDEDPGEKRSC